MVIQRLGFEYSIGQQPRFLRCAVFQLNARTSLGRFEFVMFGHSRELSSGPILRWAAGLFTLKWPVNGGVDRSGGSFTRHGLFVNG
jgi:hypothetical protein